MDRNLYYLLSVLASGFAAMHAVAGSLLMGVLLIVGALTFLILGVNSENKSS